MTTICHTNPSEIAESNGHLATGPITPEGKASSSRNATTHGLFARETVLPYLGEDPDAFQNLQNELIALFAPTNSLEQQCVETIAAATWRLRRFRQWLTALYQDLPAPNTSEGEERLARLERTQRHERALQRQIDAALRTLGRTLPELVAERAAPALTPLLLGAGGPTPSLSRVAGAGASLSPSRTKNCQNELPPPILEAPKPASPPIHIAQTRCAKRKNRRR